MLPPRSRGAATHRPITTSATTHAPTSITPSLAPTWRPRRDSLVRLAPQALVVTSDPSITTARIKGNQV